MEKSIVGREKEKAGLKEYMLSERSEFIEENSGRF